MFSSDSNAVCIVLLILLLITDVSYSVLVIACTLLYFDTDIDIGDQGAPG